MGLPLGGNHDHLTGLSQNADAETILFKSLVRLICRLFNADLSDSSQWTDMSERFDIWQSSVPGSFYIPITWPLAESIPTVIDPFTREIWFANDISAITIAFYHMARMILLVNRPMEVFSRDTCGHEDLERYSTLQHDLQKHAMEIIPIMNAMPSETVQKHMLQPLYVAGRCLIDDQERQGLLRILSGMSDDFGLFTDYRMRDLCQEWGMPCDGIDRRDGHGILT